MKIIELFSGNGDITREMAKRGHDCVSVDYDANKNPIVCADVYKLEKTFYEGANFIWASPDCTTYSLASHGLHRIKGGVAVSDYAKECDMNNKRLLDLLRSLDIPFIVENPRAHFRNKEFVRGLYRVTVYYSTYGAPYSKPTDLFSNRPLSGLFNEKVTYTHKHLDYCAGYNNFLGRCKIPEKLLINICDVMEILDYDEY